MQALSSTSPLLLMNTIPPSMELTPAATPPPWKTADSASSAPGRPQSPNPHAGASPPFGLDPPRPPREGYE